MERLTGLFQSLACHSLFSPGRMEIDSFFLPQTQSSSDKVTLTLSLNDYPLPSKRTIFFDLIVLKTNFDQIGNKTYTIGSTPLLFELPAFTFSPSTKNQIDVIWNVYLIKDLEVPLSDPLDLSLLT